MLGGYAELFFAPGISLVFILKDRRLLHTCLAYPKKSSPSLESVIPLLVRLKITIFISFSNSWIALVKLGCETYSLLAASVMVPVSATVIHTLIAEVSFFSLFFILFTFTVNGDSNAQDRCCNRQPECQIHILSLPKFSKSLPKVSTR